MSTDILKMQYIACNAATPHNFNLHLFITVYETRTFLVVVILRFLPSEKLFIAITIKIKHM